MASGYLTKVGPYRVEHFPCPGPAGGLVGDRPKGVLHTTEGSFASALAVFRKANAPTFLVGLDRGQLRICQLRPLGGCAAALEHPAGTPETNRAVRVQIEIADFSQTKPWLPHPAVVDALAYLALALRDTEEIPLRHPSVLRDETAFERSSGWIGHADVPNNHHWDPGAFKWAAFFRRCKELDEPSTVEMRANARRLDALRAWIVKRRFEGWGWGRVKASANFREYLRRGGK